MYELRLARAARKELEALPDALLMVVPIKILPGLAAAPPAARRRFELLGGGIGIHFPLCDEDISVANLLQPQLTMAYRRTGRSARRTAR